MTGTQLELNSHGKVAKSQSPMQLMQFPNTSGRLYSRQSLVCLHMILPSQTCAWFWVWSCLGEVQDSQIAEWQMEAMTDGPGTRTQALVWGTG